MSIKIYYAREALVSMQLQKVSQMTLLWHGKGKYLN